MKKQTICSAAIEALEKNNKPLSAQSIFDYITKNNLYDFKAKSPLSILKSELRKHSEGITLPLKARVKYFQLLNDGNYWLKDKPLPK